MAGKRPYWTGPRVVALLVAVILPFQYDRVLSSNNATGLAILWAVCTVYACSGLIRTFLPPFFGRSWRR